MVLARKLTEGERAEGYSQVVFVRQAEPTTGGVQLVNPITGKTSGSIGKVEFERRQKGSRKFKGELFVFVDPTPAVRLSIAKREEAVQREELAEAEAEFEAGRIERGLPEVPLERSGAAKLLEGKLAEREPEVKVREKEFLTRQVAPGGERGELKPRKALIGRVSITEPSFFEDEIGVVQQQPEIIRPKKPLKLFSPLARERLGLTETPQGLLEVGVGERKLVILGGRIRADLPKSAEFRTGFEVGTGKFNLVGFKTPTGVLTFKTIGEKFGLLEKKFAPLTRKFFGGDIEYFKEEELKLRREVRKLKGPSLVKDRQLRKLIAEDIKRIPLRIGQVAFGGEIGIRRQIREQPLETTALIVGGAGLGFISGAPAAGATFSKASSLLLGGAFVGVTGVQTGLQIRAGKFRKAGEVLGERATEALIFTTSLKAGKVGKKVFKKYRFERKIRIFEEKLPKFTEAELEARLETGGIKTRTPREIQTTFDTDLRVKTAEEALRTRIFEKAKTSIRRVRPPSRVAIIQTDILDVTKPSPKIITLEKIGKFDVSKFGKAPEQFTKLRLKQFEFDKIMLRQPGVQELLIKPTPKTGAFKMLRKPPKITLESRPVTIFTTEPTKGAGLNLETIVQKQGRVKLVKLIEKHIGKPSKLTPRGFASQKGFVFVEPVFETPRFDITSFGGKEVVPSPPPTIIKPPSAFVSPSLFSFNLFGMGRKLGEGLRLGEGLDTFSRQELGRRSITGLRSQQDLISGLDRITGTSPKPAVDLFRGVETIQQQEQAQEQEQLLITIPDFPKPPRGRIPDFPIIEEPPPPPPPPPPPLFPFLPKLRLMGEPIKRPMRPLKPDIAFTPDFIAAIANQFGAAPRQRLFTGQERRFRVKGRRFVSPLPKATKSNNIFSLVRGVLRV